MKRYYTLLIAILISVSLTGQVEKKVVIEHFTNTKCSTCANKNPALYQTLEDYPQVLHIAYHPSSPYSSCVFSQHNPEHNDARANFYNVYGATPRAVIQGNVLPIQTPLVKVTDIEGQLGMTSDYKVTISNSQVSGEDYKVSFSIELISGSGGEVLVYAGLAEEEVNYNAPNGEDLHYDVFRMMLREQTIVLSSVGESESEEVEYTMSTEWNSDQMFAYIIIQDPETKEVLQSGSTLESVSSVFDRTNLNTKNILYPNPATSLLNIRSDYINTVKTIDLYSIVGTKVKQFEARSQLIISELPEGIYIARIVTTDNVVVSERIIIGSK